MKPTIEEQTLFAARGVLTGNGAVRRARKAHRCVCADQYQRWEVTRTCEHGYSTSRYSNLPDAEARYAALEANPRQHCHGGRAPHSTLTITPVPNPDYRPDCLGDIAPGDIYFEYLGEAMAYQSGERYCAPCAVEVWVR